MFYKDKNLIRYCANLKNNINNNKSVYVTVLVLGPS
jgi:hypothetical protein